MGKLTKKEMAAKAEDGRELYPTPPARVRPAAQPYLGPAKTISDKMANRHGAPQLTSQQIAVLATQMYRVYVRMPVAQRINDTPSKVKVLREVKTVLAALSKLVNIAEAQSGPRAHARALIENNLNIRDENGVYVSPASVLKDVTKIYPALKDEYGRLEDQEYIEDWSGNVPEPRSRATPKTELIGRHLPNLYHDLYPGGSVGGTDAAGDRYGPLYTFVELVANALGVEKVNAEQIHAARARSKQAEISEM